MAEPGWWRDRPWRLVQTNLRESDMEGIDADRYVESLRSFHATVAMINTSGIVASYPTRLGFHTPSAFLHGDDLATIVDACHAADIRVIARTDFSKVRRALFERHPEWAYRRADGEVVDEWGDVHVCPSGAYQKEMAPRIVEETITTLDVDGIYFNMSGFQTKDYAGRYHGICHCDACVTGFEAMFGLALPEAEDLDDPVFRRYEVFKRRTVREIRERLHAPIRRLRPDMAIDRAFGAGEPSPGFVRQESGTALDRPAWHYGASDNTKWVVCSFPGTVSSNASVDFVDYPVRHVAVSPNEQRLRLAQALANGGGLDYYVIGPLDGKADRSGFAGVREVFGHHAAHEDDYRDLRSCAEVALLTGPYSDEDERRGWFRVLAESHFLFDCLHVDAVDEVALGRYRALVVADHQPLSDAASEAIDRFVDGGGTLVATCRSGFRDQEYEPRGAPALACLGIGSVREVRTGTLGSYLAIDDREAFPRLAETDLVFLDGPYVDAAYTQGTRRLLRLVAPGPFGPPERCEIGPPGDEPGLVVNRFGRGRAVYVPWACGALFQRHGLPNTGGFMADVLERHAGVEPLGGDLSPMVEATLLERGDGSFLLLHLVNGSGHFGQSYLEPVGMRDVRVTLPLEAEPSEVLGLVGGQAPDWAWADGRLEVRLPELGLFEGVKIVR